MKRSVAAAGIVLLVWASPANAQFLIGPGPTWGGGYFARGSFNLRFGGGNFVLSGFTAQVVAYPGPGPFGFALCGPPPFAPAWGGFGWVPPPVVVAAPPVVVINAADLFPPNPDLAVLAAQNPPRRIPVEEKAFIAIRPGKPAAKVAANLPAPPQPVVIAPPRAPAGPLLDFVGDKKADPQAEAARQVELAQAAFAAGAYGRAAERLAVAIAAKPDEPQPHFLLGQVRLARGEYVEAVAAIRDGLRLAPNWPFAAFRPREFYGEDAARYDIHLAELRRVVAAHPDDATVAFLLGYQLWFIGERDEAVMLFRRATKQVRDNAIIERFLQAAADTVARQ